MLSKNSSEKNNLKNQLDYLEPLLLNNNLANHHQTKSASSNNIFNGEANNLINHNNNEKIEKANVTSETSFLEQYSKNKTIKNADKYYNSASFLDILRYAKFYDWCLLVVGLLTSCIVGALVPVNSLIFRGITDVLMEGQQAYTNNELDMNKFLNGMKFYICAYFILGLVIFILTNITMSSFSTLCERQIHQIRKKFFEAILNQEMAWFDKNEVGKLTQKMSSGIERIRNGTSDKILIFVQAVSTILTGITVAMCLSWKFSMVILILVPFIIISIYGYGSIISKSLRGEIDAYGSAGAVADEVLYGIRIVASFNAQYFEIKRYEKFLKIARQLGIRKALTIAFFMGLYLFFLFGTMCIGFWYGSTLVLAGNITPGTVFGAFWAILSGAMRFGNAVPQINTIIGAKLAAGEILSIIDKKPLLDASSNEGIKLKNVNGRIEFKNIYFSYPTRPNIPVLKGISFEIEAGETIALVGHSGCGKSTQFELLMRYYKPQDGSISIDGNPIENLNIEWLRNQIGIVAQEPILFATTVEQNLRMGRLDVTMEEIIQASKMANAHTFIQKLQNGYYTTIGEGGIKLSGGQKQRLAIARALIRNPKILLLDEATSALDTESEQIVQKAIDKAATGRTTIMIAHRLSTVRNANRILVFDNGRIVESGSHNDLMQLNGIYKQLILAQEINQIEEESSLENFKMDDFSLSSSNSSNIDNFMANNPVDDFYNIRKSIISISSEFELIKIKKELKEEGAKAASILDILNFARPERFMIIWGFILSILRGITWPSFSIIYGRVFLTLSTSINLINNNNNNNSTMTITTDEIYNQTIFNSLLFLLVGIMAALTTFSSGSLLGIVGEKLTMRFRLAVFKNILRQDSSFFDDTKHSTGKLTARLASDASNVQAAIDQRLADVLQGITSLVAAIIVSFYFGWNVAPIGLATALILVILQTSVSNYLKKCGMKDIELGEEASRITTESIENVRTVQALTLQKFLHENFCEALKVPLRKSINRGLSYSLANSFIMFNFAIAYLFGMFMISNGYSTPFIVFQVIEALNMASIMIMNAAVYFPEYLRAKIAAGLMFSLIKQRPKIDNLSERGIKTPIKGNLEINDLHFAYPKAEKHLILNGLNLTAEFGKTIALIGPSGCGKSTVIQLIERFYDYIGGCLKIDNTDTRLFNIRHLRNAIGLVGQEPTLFNLTISENISYGLDESKVDKTRIEMAAKLANIHSFIDSLPLKYNTLVGGRGTQLSGGQKQRIAIARAIIRDPKILLLDEATSSLDSENEKIVQDALEKARKGRTCLVIAHRLSTIQRADLIVVVREGRVVESGTHQQLLLQKGLYSHLVEKQSN